MLAKNGFRCPLLPNYRYTLDNVREAFRCFSEEFEEAVGSGKLLRFDISSNDDKCLLLFSDEDISSAARLQMLFNDALDDIKMSYAVLSAMRAAGTPRVYCRIVRYNWYKMKYPEASRK